MKRKILAVLMTGTLILGLAGCGSSSDSAATPDTGSGSGTEETAATEGGTTDKEASSDEASVDLSGSKLEIDLGSTIDGATLEHMQTLIEEFGEQTGCSIDLVTNGTDHEAIMKTRMASNDMPDIWDTHGWAVLRYGDFAADLSQEAWVDRVESGIKAVVTDENGKVDALPITLYCYGIVYNADVFEAQSIDPYSIRTWDDLFEVCEQLKSAGVTPISLGTKETTTLAGYMETCAAYYTIENAAYPSNDALLDGTFDWTQNTQFMDNLATLYDNGYISDGIFTSDLTTAEQNVGAGECAMMLWGSPAYITAIKSYYPDVNLGILPTPAVLEGSNQAFTIGEGICLAVSKDSENMAAALAFLDYVAEQNRLTELVTINGNIPGFDNIVPDNSYAMDLYNASVKEYQDTLSFTNFFDREYLPSGMWNNMQESVALLLNGEVGTAKDRVGEASEFLQTNFVDLYNTVQE